MTDGGYLEGFDSLVLDEPQLTLTAYPSDVDLLQEAGDIWAVARLRWFADDFLKVSVENDRLLLSDLRMGQEPAYVFVHAVAERGNPHWHEIEPEHISITLDERALSETWTRIWSR